MASFEGKVIVITGAASGIGLSIARLLASRGATISVADIREDPLNAATESIKKATPNVKIFSQVVNVALFPEVESWIEQTVSKFGKIDGVLLTFVFFFWSNEHRFQLRVRM